MIKILSLLEDIGKDIIKGAEVALAIGSVLEPQYKILFSELGIALQKLSDAIPTSSPIPNAVKPLTLTKEQVSQVVQAVTTMHVINSLPVPAATPGTPKGV